MPESQEQFRVQLEVYLEGPPAEWDAIANRLEARVATMRLAGGYLVTGARVDEATDDLDA